MDVKTLEKLLSDLDNSYNLLNNVLYNFGEDLCHDLCEDLLRVEAWTKQGMGFPLDTRKARISIAKYNNAKGSRKHDYRSNAISEVSSVISSFKAKVTD